MIYSAGPSNGFFNSKWRAAYEGINRANTVLKFQDMPVSELLNNIEETYGIDIVYDHRLFGECLLTASFTTESLYEKMDLICKGIEASFEVIDGKMIVTGRGCN